MGGCMTKKLGERLVDAGLITTEQLELALKRQKRCGGLFGSNLVLLYMITEDELLAFLAKSTGVKSIDLKSFPIPERVLKMMTKGMVEKYNVIPVAYKKPNTLEIACADPTNIAILDELSFITGRNIVPLLSTYSSILEAITRYYSGVPFTNGSSAPQECTDQQIVLSETGHKRLGQLLVEADMIQPHQLNRALKRQCQQGGVIGRNLIEIGAISEQKLKMFLARQMGVKEVNLSQVFFSRELLEYIPLEVAEKYHVVPIAAKDGELSVACLDPTDFSILDQLQFYTGMKIKAFLASYAAINQIIDQYYRSIPLGKENPAESTPSITISTDL
ncbi:MAG: hypothetical protein CSA81_03395 [Acidobacteria bacterium]|nr:MAG: hypothetical protein CSA81_03395 [Acidobacteriota bacterium]